MSKKSSLSTGVEMDPLSASGVSGPELAKNDRLLPGRHFRLTQVEFRDGTDRCDNLVHEKQWLLHPSEKLQLQGNLFCVEALDRGEQTLFIQASPLPHARCESVEVDLAAVLDVRHGLLVSLSPGPWKTLSCGAGEWARLRALRDWQRSLRPATRTHQLPALLSNTWGDRSRDSRMNQGFIEAEIDAAAELGVDVVQLDDGWQKGMTANSSATAKKGVWEGFWNADPEFWTPHPERFPNGLEPVARLIAAKGMSLGLWFAPDSWNDFANWEKDAAVLLDYHRQLGVCHVKIDAIKMRSPSGLDRLRAMVSRVLEGSEGKLVFDLDITAEIRPGYFGLMECGPLFVENRYTDWVNHWPHHTLRNLWQLTRWMDPLRLRMEFLNNERNQDLYGEDPLAPSRYTADALFATVMCANPLGWFEVTGLSARYLSTVAPLVRIWKEHREAMTAGTLIPIGPCPDGFNHSGFLIAPDEGTGNWYLLLFRGHTDEAKAAFQLPAGLPERWTVLAGSGTLQTKGHCLEFQIPAPHCFLFAVGTARSSDEQACQS